MTGKIQVILFGTFLAILFFIIIRKLSKKKVKKNSIKEEKLLDSYLAYTILTSYWLSSIYSRTKLILFYFGVYLVIYLLLKILDFDSKIYNNEKYLKLIVIINCLIFTIYQFVFFLTLKNGIVIKNFNQSAYIITMIYLLIGFFIVNIYFLIKNLRTIFTKKDLYRKVFTIINGIFILSQAFFIIYNLVKADKFVFY
ncbi:MAG: hypothetical protein E6076_07125 [Peptoniphilus harei]|uniref:hypothetical protein n=1 Tax=Peptoniphilus harei TaxID=54005 RepID=UPI00290F9230|nr:hypothetical protein [Peptoniphilus harei]MDU5471596.1 hypothetical protein [Peptoniphilus harei]